MYTLQSVPLGGLPEETRNEISSGIWKASIVLALVSATSAAIVGGLAAPKKKGKVAALVGIGAGVSTLGTALLMGRYGLKKADASYDTMASGSIEDLLEKLPFPGTSS